MPYLEHTAAAVIVQTAIAARRGNWWVGAVLASAYFVGREVAQAEYRWIEVYGHGLRANMPWWAPLDHRVWPKLDQWVDWAGPLLATCGLAVIMQRRKKKAGAAR